MFTYLQFVLVFALAFSLGPPEAEAAKRLRAKIFITQKRIPKNLNERKLISFAKANRAKSLKEQTGKPLAKRKWIADMVVAFNAPPGDFEYHALFFDISGGGRRYVDDLATMIGDKTRRTFLQKIKLRKPMFEPGKKYEVVITIRRAEIATAQFETSGQQKKRTGRVDFSDDETK